MKVMCQWHYFTGTYPHPVAADPSHPTKDKTDAIAQWDYDDAVSSYFLSQKLPDTTKIHLANCANTQERWKSVTKEYQAKSAFAQADLCPVFLDMKCTKGGNI